MKGNWRLNENNLASIWHSALNFKHTSALEIIPTTRDGKEAGKFWHSRFFTWIFFAADENNFSSRRLLRWGVLKANFSLLFFKVSWIRKRDLHILTTGSSSYTSDQRFQVSPVIDRFYLLRCHVCFSYSRPLIGFEKDLWLSTSAPCFSPLLSDISRRWYDRMTWVIGRYR